MLDDQFTVKFNLIGKAASNPAGIHLKTFAVNTYIKRPDLSVIIEGGNDGNDRHGKIIM